MLADDFKEFVNRPGLSPFTRDKYYYRLRPFVALHGDKDAEQVTTAMLADFIALQPNLADPSRAVLRSCFHAFLAFCGVDPNPAKGLPRWRETPRRVLVPQEQAVRLALAEAVRMTESQEPARVRDGLIFALAVVSGNRRGELRNMPADDLQAALRDPQETPDGTVYRVWTAGKTGAACCRFTAFHLPLIDRYLTIRPDTASPFLFVNLNPLHERYGRQLSLVAFDRVRPKVCKRAGVACITYQELRRRLATVIARAEGVDVAALALNHSPHSGDRVIRAYYFDPDKAAADKAAAAALVGLVK